MAPVMPGHPPQVDSLTLPELSALDIESQLIEFENSSGDVGAVENSSLASEVTSLPKSESQVSAPSPFSNLPSESQASYCARTPQQCPPVSQRHPAPIAAQQRSQQIYVPHQQQQPRYPSPEGAPPPPPPYPGSSRLPQPQPIGGWRPQGQPQASQRYAPPGHYQPSVGYLPPGQQQQQQQQRFAGAYRPAMAPSIMPAVPSSGGGPHQSPYPSYEGCQQMPSSGMPGPDPSSIPNQQLTNMLRQGKFLSNDF